MKRFDYVLMGLLVLLVTVLCLVAPQGVSANPIPDLQAELERLMQIGEEDFTPVPGGIIRLGNQGERVRILTERLQDFYPEIEVTDEFTEAVKKVVKRYQTDSGLGVDGIVGPQTRAALNFSVQDKIRLIRQSVAYLEDIDFFERYILVNIPSQEMVAYWWNIEQIRSRVIAGRPKYSTPLMTTNLYSVKYNPDWSVPPGITRRYRTKLIKEGSSYFRNKGIMISYNSQGQATFYQPPGPNNALGRLKFELDNNKSIFMHDTNASYLFERPTRLYSSGCVRVQAYQELAAWVLNENVDYVINNIRTGRTYWEKVEKPVPVHIVYVQAWPNELGQINYYPDVYGKNG